MRKKINKEKVTKGKKYSFKDKLSERMRGVGLDYVFTFGNYWGYRCNDICEEDPAYIRWCMQKKILDFEKEVIDYMIICERDSRKKKENFARHYEEVQKNVKEEARRSKEDLFRNARWRESSDLFNKQYNFAQGGRCGIVHPSEMRPAKVNIVSPAAQWDHLPDKQKHGKVLGIQGGARITKKAIRDLYKKRMLEYHPDKCEFAGEEIKKLSHEMTLRINEAYEYFKRVYDV